MRISTEIMIRQAKTEDKPLEIKIGYPTPEVKVQVMAGTKAIMKVNTIRVTLDTGATADLISSKLASSLGCKIRRDHGEYRIKGDDKKELRISGTTTVRLHLPTRDWESITDAKIEEGMRSRESRSNMRKTKDRKGFNKGNYILYQEQVGPNAGKWVRTLEVLEARTHEKYILSKT